VLASFRGDQRVAGICREHDLSETLLRRWCDRMVQAGAERFTDGQDRSGAAEQRRRIAELERALGNKTYELWSSGRQVAPWPERRAPFGRRRPCWRWRSRRIESSAVLAHRTAWKWSQTIRARGNSARIACR